MDYKEKYERLWKGQNIIMIGIIYNFLKISFQNSVSQMMRG